MNVSDRIMASPNKPVPLAASDTSKLAVSINAAPEELVKGCKVRH